MDPCVTSVSLRISEIIFGPFELLRERQALPLQPLGTDSDSQDAPGDTHPQQLFVWAVTWRRLGDERSLNASLVLWLCVSVKS